jgi:flagellar FliL protein
LAEDTNTKEVKPKFGLDIKIIVIGLIIFLVAMGASYFLMKSLMAPLMPKVETNSKTNLETATLVGVPEFTTNISDVAGNRYLKVEVSVELGDKKNAESIKTFMPIIRDSILTILTSKTVADLDVRNRGNIKQEIQNDLNSKLGKDYIKNIYFTNFIMQ